MAQSEARHISNLRRIAASKKGAMVKMREATLPPFEISIGSLCA